MKTRPLSTEARRVSRATVAILRHVEGCAICSPVRAVGLLEAHCHEGRRLLGVQDQALTIWRAAAPPIPDLQRAEIMRLELRRR